MEEYIKNMSKEELLEYLEDISKQLDNIALDQIPIAISELQFFRIRYNDLIKENKQLKVQCENEFKRGFFMKVAENYEKTNAEIINIPSLYVPKSVIQNTLEKLEEVIKITKENLKYEENTDVRIRYETTIDQATAGILVLQELLEERNK